MTVFPWVFEASFGNLNDTWKPFGNWEGGKKMFPGLQKGQTLRILLGYEITAMAPKVQTFSPWYIGMIRVVL